MKVISRLFLILLLAGSLQAGEIPPVIYVMDFDTSNAQVSLGQDQPVTQMFSDIAAMTLSNQLVKKLTGEIASAQRITQRSQAIAPGWLISGSFQRITLVNSVTVTGSYKMEATAVVTDLSHPEKPLGTFPVDSSYYKGNESNAAVEGNDVPEGPSTPKSPGEQLAKGLNIDSARAARQIVEQIKKQLVKP